MSQIIDFGEAEIMSPEDESTPQKKQEPAEEEEKKESDEIGK